MQPKQEKPTEVGVIIGRFQVDALHSAHIDLINFVRNRHSKIIILLGVSRVPGTRRNPLDFDARRLMIQELYPDIIVLPIMDTRFDETWSKAVDSLIASVLSPGQKPTLYGSRDSFIPHYKGSYPVIETEDPTSIVSMSGTQVRERLSNSVQSNRAFRAGAIWQSYQRFPLVISTVDIAIVDFAKDRLLLGRKPDETRWRFIGGFADKRDDNDEASAKREVREETGLEVGDMYYLGSFNINDWRYKDEVDGIRTRFFVTPYIFGSPIASDDIAELRWLSIAEITEAILNKEHIQLYEALMSALTNSRNKYNSLMLRLKDENTPITT